MGRVGAESNGLMFDVRGLKLFNSILIFSILIFIGCNNPSTTDETKDSKPQTTNLKLQTPAFNSDSAYSFLEKQVKFGPRVPGTNAHAACAEYLKQKISSYGFLTQIQSETIGTCDGKKFRLKNIIAEYKPELSKRILLTAHWDTRPWADQDSIDKYKPFDGADDGASGVAVLLEVARLLQNSNLNIGVDIIFFDLEDYGQEQDDERFPQMENSWCLGSQYWAKNLHKPNYYAQFGILLDMVGGKNPAFPREGTSVRFAPDEVNKVWSIAQNLGYSQFFTNTESPPTTDDHLYVNQLANIHCIDIVHYETSKMNYASHHHTHADNLNVIDKNTLQMVGHVVLETVFSEQVSN